MNTLFGLVQDIFGLNDKSILDLKTILIKYLFRNDSFIGRFTRF